MHTHRLIELDTKYINNQLNNRLVRNFLNGD